MNLTHARPSARAHRLCALAATATVLLVSPAAFSQTSPDGTADAADNIPDDEKKGGLMGNIGLGIGAGSVAVGDGAAEMYVGMATDLSIGWGVSPQLYVHAALREFWFQLDDEFTLAESVGAGATWFLDASNTGPFITGTVGMSIFVPVGDPGATKRGFTAGVGAGYEFKAHWTAKINALYSTGDNTFMVVLPTINYLFY